MKHASIFLRIFFIALAVWMGFFAFAGLPGIADELARENPQAAWARSPVLYISWGLTVLFFIGIFTILWLLAQFDHGKLFTYKVVHGLRFLIILSFLAAALVFVVFIITLLLHAAKGSFATSFILLVCLIVAGIVAIIRDIIQDGMNLAGGR